jgi:4-amino-4-deoxy-L-arabinose transferase-like glycosyltransferase
MLDETSEPSSDGFSRVINKYYLVFVFLIFGVSVFNCFFSLANSPPVQPWDEARYGISAFEMIKSHDFIRTTFNFKTDLWNLKPPLNAWLVALSFKIFGYSTFALRFFSALFSLLTILIAGLVMKNQAGPSAGLVSSLALSTTIPFIFIHGARSGTCASMLAFLALLCIFFIVKIETRKQYFYLCGFLLSVAFLLYGFASVQILIILFVYLFLFRKQIHLTAGQWAVFSVCALLPVTIWTALRLNNIDGVEFIKKMFTYDVIRRSTESIEEHYTNGLFYFQFIVKENMPWIFSLFIFMLLSRKRLRDVIETKTGPLLILAVILPFIIFSLSKTRMAHYINPIYPPLAMLTGWMAGNIFTGNNFKMVVRATALILVIFSSAASETLIVKRIISEGKLASPEPLLRSFAGKNMQGQSAFFIKDWYQGEIFTAEAVCGLNVVAVRKWEDCLKEKGYLLLRKNEEPLKLEPAKKFIKVLENENWMIIQMI